MPSERAFFVINLRSKIHNSLKSERVTSLPTPISTCRLYAYCRRINTEVLAHPVLDFYELTEEEEIGLEEQLLYT